MRVEKEKKKGWKKGGRKRVGVVLKKKILRFGLSCLVRLHARKEWKVEGARRAGKRRKIGCAKSG